MSDVSLFAKCAQREHSMPIPIADSPREIVSSNSKTGVSVNFPVAATCRPSKTCSRICYAYRPNSRLNLDNALSKVVANYQYFLRTPTVVVAERIAKEYRKYAKRLGLNALRWNGVGDLFEESVAVINHMAATGLDITHYVISQKPEMLNRLALSDRLVGLLSMDEDNWRHSFQFNRPGTLRTYLRTSEFLPPIPIDIIFRAQHQWRELPADVRDCLCDAHLIDHNLSCVACGKCYNVESQHEAGYARESPAGAGGTRCNGGDQRLCEVSA